MKAYAVTGPSASGSANKSAITIIGASTVRPRICDVTLGFSTVPADQAAIINLQRFTAVGTAASNPTPEPLDPNEAAALATAGITHSAEPTYTANKALLHVAMNQRATYRWVAQPDREFVGPATASNGIGAYLVSAGAAMVLEAAIVFVE